MGIILGSIAVLFIIQPCLIGLKILTDLKWHWAVVLTPTFTMVILGVLFICLKI